MGRPSGLFLLFQSFIDQKCDDKHGNADEDIAQFVTVLRHLGHELFLGLYAGHGGQIVAYGCQNAVPYPGTQRGVEQEGGQLHAGQSGRYADELAHGGDKSAYEGGDGSVLVEEFFGFLHAGLVDEAHVAYPAVGELIDNGPSQPFGKIVVEESTDVGSYGGDDDDEEHVQLVGDSCLVGCGWHNDFGREGDERTLDGHQQGDGPIVEVVKAPLYEGCGFHCTCWSGFLRVGCGYRLYLKICLSDWGSVSLDTSEAISPRTLRTSSSLSGVWVVRASCS